MKIIIEGAGEVGSHIAKALCKDSNDVTVIDADESKLAKLASTIDVATIKGDTSSISPLREAGVEKADLFIAVNPFVPQDVNLVSALIAKKIGCKKVCARVDSGEYFAPENRYLFQQMGIDMMIYPERFAAAELRDMLKNTASLESMDFSKGKLQMEAFKVEDDGPLADITLKEFCDAVQTENTTFRVVAVSRDSETLIPKPDTRFKYHDIVYIISTRDGMARIMEYLHKTNLMTRNLMIAGGSSIGEILACSVASEMDQVKIIEPDLRRCEELRSRTPDNVSVIHSDFRNFEVLVEENIKDMDAFVAVTGNDEQNVLACVAARKYGISKIIADVENEDYITLAEQLGVDSVINKKKITIGKILTQTSSDKARLVKYLGSTDAEMIEYKVKSGALITTKPLKDLNFPEDAIIGGVIRGHDSFIAVGDTRIEAYDSVAVFTLPGVRKKVELFFK